jgi:7-cyano-7-deazaguanine reductase
VDERIRKKVQNLKLEYRDYPQKELLVALPNPSPNRDYEEVIISSEFTTLCPLNPGQPDFATLTIKYTPDKRILELKSVKFYLTSYRMVEIFFEEATNRVLDDLADAIKPKRMEVVAEWNIRGGIGTVIVANYEKNKRVKGNRRTHGG